ncbi:MAG: hypothetical protein RLZZ171_1545 [Cyanobacteriota bacterium]|jgi:hypothetical protein
MTLSYIYLRCIVDEHYRTIKLKVIFDPEMILKLLIVSIVIIDTI